MSKYILEIKPEYEDSFKGLMVLGAKDSNLFVDTVAVDDLEELNSDYINEHFGDLQDTAYQRGLDEAWGAVRKIVEMWDTIDNDELLAIFGITAKIGKSTIGTLFKKQTASEAITKLKAYEEEQNDKFEFGDEIIDSSGVKGCVVSKDNEGSSTMYALFDGCRVPQYVTQSNYRKTGKHYDIDRILDEIKGDNDK